MDSAPSRRPAVRKSESVQAANRVRLHVRIAHAGVCARRAAEELIRQGRVSVNGEIVVRMGETVGPEDEVRVDGELIREEAIVTVLLNKPSGYVTTLRDPQGRQTVAQLLPRLGATVKPVGRLDMDTEGLLLFTNDGELANRLAHPKFGVEKEYSALVKGVPTPDELRELTTGVFVEGRRAKAVKAFVKHADPRGATSQLVMVLHEGRKRQVKLMCLAINHPVMKLKRTRYGPLVLRGMRPGECRLLSQVEVKELKRIVGLA